MLFPSLSLTRPLFITTFVFLRPHFSLPTVSLSLKSGRIHLKIRLWNHTQITSPMDSPASAVRRPCFAEEDDGLASIAEFSGAVGNHYSHNTRRYPVFSRIGGYSATASTSVVPRRTGSLRNLASLSTVAVTAHCSSPRSGRIFDPRFEEANHSPHFLEACFLCKKPLGGNKDIFMYRGDMPFCSEECRREQIEVDEAKEKSLSLSASMKAMRKKQKDATSAQQNAASSPDKSQKYRAGTVAAA